MKPRIIQKKWWIPLPLPGYEAITLYPLVFLRPNWEENTIRHELIHIWQAQKRGFILFYFSYFVNWLRFGYSLIPFEVEAYCNEKNDRFLPLELELLVRRDPNGVY